MKEGFTLIETLVVVAIIAILLTLFLPMIQTARERGDAAHCVSNLRQLAAANLVYAGENGGQFVFAQDRHNLIRWHGIRSSISGKFDPTKGPLAPYLGLNGTVKICPALLKALSGSDSFEDGSGGYGYNAAYIGGTPRDTYTPERTANIAAAARTVMFSDTAFAREDGIQEYPFSEPWQDELPDGTFDSPMSASVHFRHLGTANVAWCDGHVTAEPPSQIDGANYYGGDAGKWKIGWFGPSDRNGYWRPSSD